MRKLSISLFAALAVIATPVSVNAATQCKDAKGKFIKCPTPKAVEKKEVKAAKMEATAAKKMATAAKKEAAAVGSLAPKKEAASGKMGPNHCRDIKSGRFAKCGTPGTKPA